MELKLPFLPPTQNRYFIIARNRLIKSSAARIFLDKVKAEKLRQFHRIEPFKAFKGRLLRVDTYYYIQKERLWTKKGEVKKLDFMNFQKMAWDALAELIDIDDKYYKAGFHECIDCATSSEECIIFKISVYEKE